MTRVELLRALIRQAKLNGFEYRKWYTTRLALPWISFDASITCLCQQRRYYALLFSHEFAHAFWLEGSKMAFVVPTATFTRVLKNGTTKTIERKGHTRRTVLPEAWRYHLKSMAVAEDPLRYIRRFLLIEEDLAGIPELSDEEDGPPRPLKTAPQKRSGEEEDDWDELDDEDFSPKR